MPFVLQYFEKHPSRKNRVLGQDDISKGNKYKIIVVQVKFMVQTTLKKSIVQPNNGKNRQKTEVFTTYTPEYISLGLWQDWQEMTKGLEKLNQYD